MDKIKCPHCGAINQDVTPQDNCWNCGKPLGAAPAATAMPTSGTTGDGGEVDAGGQKLKTAATLEERVAARKQERLAARRTNPLVPVLAVVLLLVLALLVYLALLPHH